MTIQSAPCGPPTGNPRLMLIALGLLIAGSTLAAQNPPLPDQESFLVETRKHLQTDSTLQSSYVYVETRRERKLDKGGRTREESVKVVESYPGLPGEERWERVVAEDGRPVPPQELARQDRERQQKADEMVQRLARDPSKELARQDRARQKANRERDEALSDFLRNDSHGFPLCKLAVIITRLSKRSGQIPTQGFPPGTESVYGTPTRAPPEASPSRAEGDCWSPGDRRRV